jgi:membrane fusion protein, multidrug efflux system
MHNRYTQMRQRFDFHLAVVMFITALTACGKQQPPPPTAPEVTIVTLTPRTVSISEQLPGRTNAYRTAEVRPQVSGIVQKRLFTEGTDVKAGQQLLQIDPSSYKATLSVAQAALKRSEAKLTTAQLLENRYTSLMESHVVSKQDFDQATAARLQAEADVADARAQIESASINLRYTQVLSPISGRIGRAFVTEGALVTAQQQQALALVQQLDPMYVDISQSSTEILKLQRQFASGDLQKDANNQAEVTLTLADGSQYSQRGKLQFSEVSVDPSTGAVVLRAIFPNPKRELLPGMFVRAQLAQASKLAALLVPQRALTRSPRGEALVMLVDGESKVQERKVETSRVIGTDWLIDSGLSGGDRIVVDGLQKIKPGVTVRTVEAGNTPQANNAIPNSAPPAQQK